MKRSFLFQKYSKLLIAVHLKLDYMNLKIKFLILTILIIGVVFTGLFTASMTQNFIFTSDLRVEGVEKNDNTSILHVFDGQTFLGAIYLRIEPQIVGLQQNWVMLSFSLFYNQTELDSVKIRFSGGNGHVSVYREATSYTWEHQFHTEGGDAVLDVPDLGWFGQSTATLDFILFPHDATNLVVDMQLSMHRTTPLQLTSLKAQVHIDAPIPQVNA